MGMATEPNWGIRTTERFSGKEDAWTALDAVEWAVKGWAEVIDAEVADKWRDGSEMVWWMIRYSLLKDGKEF